jgi:elongation factor P--(R)-beta-lysine ligase
MIQKSPFWMPHVHQDRRAKLLQRNAMTKATRQFFEDKEFVEVETAILQVSPGNETHLHGFATDLIKPDASIERLYLHTSPEFACKKLLAAGEQRIFTLARVFRNRERGALHVSEFTMLEWYRVGENYTQLMEDCTDLVRALANAVNTKALHYRGKTCDVYAEFELISVCEAFMRFAGIDLARTFTASTNDRDALADAALKKGVRIADDDTWGDIFSRILCEFIEPNLGVGQLTILYDYPICEASLARPKPDAPHLAERFELYACGVELANAFGELTNAHEQRLRFEADMIEKQRIYGESYPIDEDFLSCLALMPEACGAALGFDRLVMLLVGAGSVDDVMWGGIAGSTSN